MANVYGPKIVRDGLVLYLDKYNERSYLGEPTTNLAVNFSAWSKDSSGHSSQGAVTLSSDNWTATIVDTDDNTRHYAYINATPGTTYTFSNKYRNLGGTSPTFRYQVSWRDSSNNNISYAWVQTAALGITDIGGWQQATYTATAPSGTVQILWYMQDGADYTGYTHNFEIKEMQFEAKPHMTKWVDGTRPVADGWRDLSGNDYHANLSSTTYSATNVPGANTNDFSFDGVDDYNSLGPDITIKSTGEWTQESWVKADTVAGGPFNFAGHQNPDTVGWYWSIFNSKLAIWNKSPGAWLYGGTTLSTGAWYQCVCVSENVDGTSYKFYLNGVNDGGTVESYTFNGSGDYKKFIVQDIGRSSATYSRYFDGQIDMSKFYNRSLTATEVLQNFNAHKGRYGL